MRFVFISVLSETRCTSGSVRRGMPANKVGRFWKFKRDKIDAWVEQGGAHEGKTKSKTEKK